MRRSRNATFSQFPIPSCPSTPFRPCPRHSGERVQCPRVVHRFQSRSPVLRFSTSGEPGTKLDGGMEEEDVSSSVSSDTETFDGNELPIDKAEGVADEEDGKEAEEEAGQSLACLRILGFGQQVDRVLGISTQGHNARFSKPAKLHTQVALELFLRNLVRAAEENAGKSKTVNFRHVAGLVSRPEFSFLEQVYDNEAQPSLAFEKK
eukprot:Hpha_TRINITY_DN15164_c4_g7::TRINITY_DN15164_c4_g7_i1::g.129320::m.129320